MSRHILIMAAVLNLVAGAAWATGGGPAPVPSTPRAPSAPAPTPEERAAMRYNDGLKQQEKAEGLSTEAEAATDAKKRGKLETQAHKAYEKARTDFEDATKVNPRDFQAYGALGYVLRRLGDYDASLKAYNTALQLKPGYTPAIEYRGEAFLGLNRVEDAKAAYMDLFNADRPKADMLAGAMKTWLGRRRQDPAGLDGQTLDEFAKWLSQRQEIAGQTSALLPPKDGKW